MHKNEDSTKFFLEKNPISKFDNVFEFISKVLLYIPGIRDLYIKSFNLVCKFVSILIRKNEVEFAYRILIYCLRSSFYNDKSKQQEWWFFMRIAIACLQQEQLQKFLIRPTVEDMLIDLGKNSSHPKTGYDASYCFVGFALWSFERGLTKIAVEHATTAANAFDLWGYPDYLIGWFNLFNEELDSVDYFCKAVQKDWSMLHRIRHDPTCKMFPNIVKEVSQRVLVANDK